MSDSQDLDRRTKQLLQAAEADLRRHLATSRLEPRLLGDLYLRIRATLVGARQSGSGFRLGIEEDLAHAIYFETVAQTQADPALLSSLRRTFLRALEEHQEGSRAAEARMDDSGGSTR